MTVEQIDAYLLGKPGAEKDFKEEWEWYRYRVREKMFAAYVPSMGILTLKLEPLEGELLRKEHGDIIPGYYMDKRNWNSVKLAGAVPDELLVHMMDETYRLVLAGLPKRVQAELKGEAK